MSKHVREKCGKLCISSSLRSKRGITHIQKLTEIDDTRTWSVVQQNKVLCKISAQYVKACKRKLRKTVYFQYFKFQKGHNSYKNWQKLTTLELDQMFIRRKWHAKFQLNISKHVGERCGKLWLTDGDPDGRTDRHHHTIIRPVWRQAYNNWSRVW